MRTFVFFAWMALSTQTLCAATHISGVIKETVIGNSGSPYIVDEELVVPEGMTLTIKEGCNFLFAAFTGIRVEGTLIVEGSPSAPVTFTSINDVDYNDKSEMLPNPFDWNGILITPQAQRCRLSNFQLRFSVFGVKSQRSDVLLENGVFRQNGQYHFTVNDKIQAVVDNIPFSFGTDANPVTKDLTTGKPLPVKQPKVASNKPNHNRAILRYSSLGVGVIGLAAGSFFLIKWNDYQTQKNTINKMSALKTDDSQRALFSSLDKKAKTSLIESVIGFGVGGLGVAGFTLTFVF